MKWTQTQRETAEEFAGALERAGFNFFTGVPCSLLGALIETLAQRRSARYVPSVREDAAIGLAAGAYLAGKKPVVLMQNSGIGYSLNVLTSLNLIYKIPCLCLVTYRGHGPDAPEHWVMGRSCEALLKEVGVEHAVPEGPAMIEALGAADRRMSQTHLPYAIFVKKGIFGA